MDLEKDSNNVYDSFEGLGDIKEYVKNKVYLGDENRTKYARALLFSIMTYVYTYIDAMYRNMGTVNKLLQMAYLKDNNGNRMFDIFIGQLSQDNMIRKFYSNIRANCDEYTYDNIINNLFLMVEKK